MALPKVGPGIARAAEERYRTSVRDAMLEHLGKTPEQAAWCEAALDVLWEYGGVSPFRVAANALHRGNLELYEHALADDARLHRLAEATKAAEAVE